MLKSFKKGATEKSRNLEKKLDQVRLESACRVQEAHDDKEKLLKEIKIHQSREDEEVSQSLATYNCLHNIVWLNTVIYSSEN